MSKEGSLDSPILHPIDFVLSDFLFLAVLVKLNNFFP